LDAEFGHLLGAQLVDPDDRMHSVGDGARTLGAPLETDLVVALRARRRHAPEGSDGWASASKRGVTSRHGLGLPRRSCACVVERFPPARCSHAPRDDIPSRRTDVPTGTLALSRLRILARGSLESTT